MAKFEVFLTAAAERDLEDIAEYIERHDSPESANYVYEHIRDAILRLEGFPLRGRVVPELKDLGVADYREVWFKPYRVVYFVSEKRVFVHCIFDGRRDAEDVLSSRLLR